MGSGRITWNPGIQRRKYGQGLGKNWFLLKTFQLKCNPRKGSPSIKKTVTKSDNVTLVGGGSPPVPFVSPNLPGPQNTRKWTMHTWNIDVKPPTFTFVCIFSREIQFAWLFLGWISNFSYQGKKFDRNRKCSERSEMDFDINLIFQTTNVPFLPV